MPTPPRRFTWTPAPPHSFALTVARFARFRDEIVDRAEGSRYRRLLEADGRLALATVTATGTVARPRLHASLEGPRGTDLDHPVFAAQLRRILGSDLDLTAFQRQARRDPLLASIVPRFRGLKLPASPTLFESLVVAVLSQQVNLVFAHSIKRELVERFGARWRADGALHLAFPRPERFAEQTPEGMRRFRLTRTKAAALVGLGEAFASGAMREDELATSPDDEIVERLVRLRGIGRWSAEIALLRGLARPDAFPAGDLGVVKYVARGLLGREEKASEAEMRAFAEVWRPYRGLALTYCYAELARRQG